ncbi:uncharacterized protein LOC127850876 [Dreissena polymorpha]|uniref:Cadherin domain-containing protein n=1 Tax=Dreissena polymorpha TaxID=45954 RepID=A0A9D4D8A0_DREPO|nr:uncharacterized protein LOC127850876 [Dreissena polymorpha]KAH3739879.1 hypothetical protein DPMN_046569 [Dreissena polymorpha]
MRVTIHYTNWPPHIISLPAQTSLHEDNDTETLLHNLKVYDYNYDAPEDGHDIEDNITCWIKYVHDQWGENDMELFDLRLDDPNDQIRWDSYKLYKKECTVPTSQYSPPCGYKRENYTCPKHSGCMTHNVTQWYNVSIMCKDGYGAIDNRNFTFYPTRNQAPTWRNLPKHLDLDLKQGSEEDIIFSIMYQDEENENLTYEYKFMKNDGTVTAYFRGDPSGNYFNQLGNISLTTYLYDVPKNTSYTIEICGHERRNEICELLTIDLEDYCGPVPTCSSLEKTVTTEEPVPSTLFDVKTAVANYASYSNITFTLTSRSANTFEIDENTGIVTLLSTLTASYPSSTYVLNAFVRDAQSCHYYSVCPLTLHVTYVNHALKIINSVTTTAIHEDEAKTLTLFTIETSDLNDDDDVTCAMTNPSVNKPFYVTETFSTSQVYVVKNYIAGTDVTKKLSSAKTVYTLDVNCTDRYGAGEVKTFTINVALNQPPVLQQLHGLVSRNVDQSTMFSGSTLITEQAFDEERDTLVYTCYVNNSNVPLKCDVVSDTLQVKLRRNVSISSEIGDVYSMKVCVGDAKHPLADCGTLQLNFTTQHSYPSISNLPAEVEVPEDAAIGYTVFTATVSDTDIPAEIHTLFLNNRSNDTIGYFELDRYAGSITLLKALDYETKKRYTLRLTVQDPFLVSPELYKLVIKVKDVNEQNYLTAKNRSITFKENAKVGRIFHIGLECTDFDEEDTQTITIAGGDHVEYFLYNITTRKIHLAKEWDLDDSISNLPSTTTLTIRCTDSAMHTSDVDIVFNIEDVNDQKPSFILDKSISNNTLSDGSVAIKVDSSTSPSEPLLTVTCVDGEKGNHGACAFSILGNGLGRRYFELRSVTTAGRRKRAGVKNSAVLYLREEMKLNYNKNFQFYVKVSDGGTPAQFTTVMLTANFTATVDPPKAAKSTTCSGSSACSTLYAILAIELAMVAGLSVYTVYSLFCKNKNKIDNLALQEAVSKDVKRRQFSNSKHRTTTFLYGETIPGKGKAGLGTFLHGPDSMPGMSTSIMARREYRTSSSSSESSSDEDDWITPTPREMPSRPQVRRIGESTRFEAPFSSNRDPTLMRHIYSSNTFLNGRLAENSNTRRSQSFSQSRDPVTGANLVKASSSLSNTDYETGLPAPIYSSDMSFRI